MKNYLLFNLTKIYTSTLSVVIIIISFSSFAYASFDPDAGRVASFTEKAKAISSSGAQLKLATDNNYHTYWESDAVLPDGFIDRSYLNVFHKNHPDRIIAAAGQAFDGDLNTAQIVNKAAANGLFQLEIPFKKASKIKLLAIKPMLTSPVKITLKTKNTIIFAGVIDPKNTYNLQNLAISESYFFESILLESAQAFGIFELACLSDFPYEFVLFDFLTEKPVQQIWLRLLSGNEVQKAFIEISNNAKNWTQVANLNPQAIPFLPIVLSRSYQTRFLRIKYVLSMKEYAKASLWEIKVYDQFGPFGPPPAFQSSRSKLSDRLGINGIWGWGFNTYSDNLQAGSGPEMFRNIASKARNYHELLWDIKQPTDKADYNKMEMGGGTQATWWLNWDREYAAWQKAGLGIVASIQFDNKSVPDSLWKSPYQNAYSYGYNFAKHFGPSGGSNAFRFVEIGNEPWDYKSGFYPTLLHGMLDGMKNADAKIKVIPAAFQATFRQFEADDYNNYIGNNVNINSFPLLDGLNGHFYPYTYDKDGKRIAVHPEDPRSGLHGSRNLLRFRSRNLPNKPVYVTEYGYDSHGGSENCLHDVCVTETQQAAWGVRAALLLLRNGIEEVFWYFFANEFNSSFLHTRSGLTSSSQTGFKKKLSFEAFKQLYDILGETHMVSILIENNELCCYLFENKNNGKQFAVVWLTTGDDPAISKAVSLNLPVAPKRSFTINGLTQTHWIVLQQKVKQSNYTICGYPLVLEL